MLGVVSLLGGPGYLLDTLIGLMTLFISEATCMLPLRRDCNRPSYQQLLSPMSLQVEDDSGSTLDPSARAVTTKPAATAADMPITSSSNPGERESTTANPQIKAFTLEFI